MSSKKRVVKDFDKLTKEIQTAVRAEYPNGFSHKLISYTGPKGEKISALPFETEEIYYLIRMSVQEARTLSSSEEDFDDLITNTEKGVDIDDIDIADSSEDENTSSGDSYDDDYDSGIISTRSRDDDGDDDDY